MTIDWEQVAAQREREIPDLNRTIATLEAKVADLERRLNRNPRNSSMPPSAEGLTKPPVENRAARRKARRRPGKQPGAEGHNLAQVPNPDETVVHRPEEPCGGCGADLTDAEVVGTEIRQVFELPDMRPHVTERQMVKVRCARGCEAKGRTPQVATAPACYGPGIRGLAVYFSVYQHVPYDRLGEIFSDVLGIPISVGAIKAMVAEAGGGLGLFLSVITDLLKDAPAVHFDETGARIEESLHRIHVACTSLYTLLVAHKKRGTIAMDDIGLLAKATISARGGQRR